MGESGPDEIGGDCLGSGSTGLIVPLLERTALANARPSACLISAWCISMNDFRLSSWEIDGESKNGAAAEAPAGTSRSRSGASEIVEYPVWVRLSGAGANEASGCLSS